MTSKKQNWLLIRGLARGTGHWGSFAELIQAQHPDANFEFLDLPGNGTLHLETSPWKISDYVYHARARCSYVQKKESFRILTLSLGAMVAVEWMRLFPNDVEHATLMCTSSRGFNPFYHRFLLKNYLVAARMSGHYKDAQVWEEGILDLVTNNRDRRQAELPGFVEFTRQHPLLAKNILRQLWAASRFQFPKTPPGPIQLIGSYGDRLVHPSCSLEIGRAWKLPVLMHASAGHDIPVDDPLWLLDKLL